MGSLARYSVLYSVQIIKLKFSFYYFLNEKIKALVQDVEKARGLGSSIKEEYRNQIQFLRDQLNVDNQSVSFHQAKALSDASVSLKENFLTMLAMNEHLAYYDSMIIIMFGKENTFYRRKDWLLENTALSLESALLNYKRRSLVRKPPFLCFLIKIFIISLY